MVQFGFRAHFVNKNAFQREDQFIIDTDLERVYEAVMNARVARWKRLELAKKVQSLALITVIDNESYYEEMREVLRHGAWVNFDEEGKYRYLSQEEVQRVNNQSHTGLILSAFEGNNKASIEYLLCGLPVVSTPSKGGRDVFFDEEYCAIVEPTPEAVREGVQEMIARDLTPTHIRAQTLEKMRDHRKRFLELVSDLAGRSLDVSVEEWLNRFPRNMKFRCRPGHFRAFLESGFFKYGCPAYTSEHTLQKHDQGLWGQIIS